ncbi:parathyroid hormone-responsive B1 [Kipferlia bialata]|uniref:Parathyroid hormone-responsive B1 n=1 Tax=Kipferlia bialata TaxID=797122 RepID=A0A9K3CW37_9EUKA|nr:parathyroid hormone-responsive B1 [Kipferlia bialata]|eukprot:g3844.t1
MSLFGTREYWATRLTGPDQEFDRDSMVFEPLETDGESRLIVGSFNGTLSVYRVRSGGHAADDVIFSERLPNPILAVCVGDILGSGSRQLLVLHPRSVEVFKPVPTATGLELTPVHSIRLKAPPCSAFITTVEDRASESASAQVLCVVSLNGTLTLFRQTQRLFSVSLGSAYILPSAVAFIPSKGQMIVSNSQNQVEAVDLDSLYLAGSATTKQRISRVWSTSVEGRVLDIMAPPPGGVLGVPGAACVVATPHSLLYLSAEGGILLESRFDNPIACMKLYPVNRPSDDDTDAERLYGILLVDTQPALSVFIRGRLAWRAKLPITPVVIQAGDISQMKGLIALLDEKGSIAVVYLGTQPSSVLTNSGKHIPLAEAEAERRQLTKDLAQMETDTKDMISLAAQVRRVMVGTAGSDVTRAALVRMSISSMQSLSDVVLSFSSASPLTLSQSTAAMEELEAGQEKIVTFEVQASAKAFVPSLQCSVTARGVAGDVMVTRAMTVHLPLSLGFSLSPLTHDMERERERERERDKKKEAGMVTLNVRVPRIPDDVPNPLEALVHTGPKPEAEGQHEGETKGETQTDDTKGIPGIRIQSLAGPTVDVSLNHFPTHSVYTLNTGIWLDTSGRLFRRDDLLP